MLLPSEKVRTDLAAKQRVSFRIFGPVLDFRLISRTLGVTPTKAFRRGSHDVWILTSPLLETEPLDSHLNWLRKVLSPHVDFLESLRSTAVLRNYCGLSPEFNHCHLIVSPQELEFLRRLGVSLEITILFLVNPSDVEDSEVQWDKALMYRALEKAAGGEDSAADPPHTTPVPLGPLMSASFSARARGCDLAQISGDLYVGQSDHFRTDERELSANGESVWMLESPLDPKTDVNAHLAWLAEKLHPHLGTIRSLPTATTLALRCMVRARTDQCAFELLPKSFNLPISLGIPITICARV
jgi:hypothetical protein